MSLRCFPARPDSGIFESEIALPVRVHYAVDEERNVEITQVVLTSEAERLFAPKPALLWPRLSVHDFTALQQEVEEEARRSTESDRYHQP